MKFEEFRVQRAPPSAYYIPDFITVEEEDRFIQQIYAAPKPKWKELSHRRLQNWGGLPHPRGMVTEHIPAWLQQHMDRIAALGAFGDKLPNHVLVNEYLPGQGIMPHEDGPMFYPTITTITLSGHTLLDLYTPRPPDDAGGGVMDGVTEEERMGKEEGEEDSKKKEEDKEDGKPDNYHSSPSSSSPSPLQNRYIGSLFLAPRSLLIIQDTLYTSHLHGIAEVEKDVLSDDVLNLPLQHHHQNSHSPGDALKRDTRISLTIRHVPKVLKNKVWLGRGQR